MMFKAAVHPKPVEGLITQHLDLWTAAIKRRSTAGRGSSSKVELYGIKKLRELILELAVRGLLVPQDPKDEPASELLKKIATEKAKLVKEGKIKKEKPLSPIGKAEEPFAPPNGWAFFRLIQVAVIRGGCTPSMAKSAFWGGDIPWVSPKDMHDGLITDSELKVTNKALDESSLELIPVGSILIVGRSGILKRKLPAQITGVPCTINQDLKALTPVAPMFDRYLQLTLLGNQTSILKLNVKQGTTVQSLVYETLFSRPFALPPLAEQHRIVAKVDELMALCDQLEQQTDASLGAHQTLVETLLNALTSAADHAQFASSWQRIAEHFDTLFTTEETIDQLKQTILQLAVMGKLVPQDPKDEPASELLKKIAAEQAKLVKEGKIKADKPLPPISDAEIPFELPKSWLWERLPKVSFFQEGPGIMAKDFRDKGVPLIRISGMHGPVVSLEGCNYLQEEMVAKKWNHFRLEEDDIVLSSSASLGKVSKVKNDAVGSIAYTGLIRFKPFKSVFDEYLIRFLGSDEFVRQIDGSKRGAAILHFGPTHLRGMIVPIPPLIEQHRIVAKVDELMALCDQLKARLSDAQTSQLNLADALTEASLAGA